MRPREIRTEVNSSRTGPKVRQHISHCSLALGGHYYSLPTEAQNFATAQERATDSRDCVF